MEIRIKALAGCCCVSTLKWWWDSLKSENVVLKRRLLYLCCKDKRGTFADLVSFAEMVVFPFYSIFKTLHHWHSDQQGEVKKNTERCVLDLKSLPPKPPR